MPPRKRREPGDQLPGQTKTTKRMSKSDRERLICKKKLDALDLQESRSTEDRFSLAEKTTLLEAYNENGFQVFQDTKLLHKYFPNRRECDLKVLLSRLRTKLQTNVQDLGADCSKMYHLSSWERLCQQLMGNFAKDKKTNMHDVFANAILAGVNRSQDEQSNEETEPCRQFDYSKILNSFASMLVGKFPESMDPLEAQISIRLFAHVDGVVDSLDLSNKLCSLFDGTWLRTIVEDSARKQEMALSGLHELESKSLRQPTVRDIEKSRHIEALCLELPKIKRITDVLNPLHINESLVRTLMD